MRLSPHPAPSHSGRFIGRRPGEVAGHLPFPARNPRWFSHPAQLEFPGLLAPRPIFLHKAGFFHCRRTPRPPKKKKRKVLTVTVTKGWRAARPPSRRVRRSPWTARSTPPRRPHRRTWSQTSPTTLIKRWTLKAIKAITILPTNGPMRRADPNSACTLPGAGLEEYYATGENFDRSTERMKTRYQIDLFYNKQRKKDVFSANSQFLADL